VELIRKGDTEMSLAGKTVLITDTSCEPGRTLKRHFEKKGAKIMSSDTPLTNQADIDSLVEETVRRYGGIDALVFSNSYVSPKSIESCTDEELEKSLAINVKSAFLFTQATGKAMIKQRSGKILYVSSIHDEKPNGADFSYSIAKGALKMMMREACLDLGIYGIGVNLLSLGALEGDDKRFESKRTPLYEHMYEMIPGKTAYSNDDAAEIALFLCSDESRMLNGADITADGGFLKSYFPRYDYEEYEELIKKTGHPVRNPVMTPDGKMPEKPNKGKVAVLTGAATSIGQGVALALAKEGVKVAVAYNSAPADETMKLIEEAGGEAIAVKTDVTSRESIRNFFSAAYDRFGEIDLLFNNAAIQPNLWLLEYTEELYDSVMQVNLKGYLTCIQEVLPFMKKGAFARIVNVASIHAERPTNFDIVYSMTKGGIKMLTREAAVELAKYDINVNQLDLGAIRVPTRSGNYSFKVFKPLEFKNRPEGGFLSGRYGYPFDVGYIVSFLLDERSQFINGAAIRADGGAMCV